MKKFYIVLFLLFVIGDNLLSQIYNPEGLNMPGGWNGWTNPPTNALALASATQVINGKVAVITTGTRRYHTTIKVATSGGDVIGGTHEFLFTSGPTATPWNNTWKDVTVTLNTLQNYNYYTSGGNNNSITVTNGKWYTVNWQDNGYASTQAIFMETSAEPITILYATDNYYQPATNVVVTIKLSGTKSVEEKVFVRYTTDNFSTSSISEATGAGDTYTATIPAGSVTGTANNKYYIFTSTVASPTHSNADVVTINYNNNDGSNYLLFSKSMTFILNAIQGEGSGPEMFSYKWTDPSIRNCGIYPCGDPVWATVKAYLRMRWNDYGGVNGLACVCTPYTGTGVLTTSSCSNETTNVLANTTGVTSSFSVAFLTFIQKIGCPTPTGDRRIYAGNTFYIKKDNVAKLTFTNYRFDLNVDYVNNVIAGSGWAQLDLVNSDPRWAKEFDPFNSGGVFFDVQSFSAVVQSCYGVYNCTFNMRPHGVVNNQTIGTVNQQGTNINVLLNMPNSDVDLLFTAASYGGDSSNSVYVNQIITSPGGSAPIGIQNFANLYWDIGTTLDTFTTSITFDLADVGGISNTANLRILKRDNSTSAWIIWTDFTLVDATHIRANNVTSFSEWTIGSTDGNPLPVELTSFKGFINNNSVELHWQTATEDESYGFEIERTLECCDTEWKMIGFVQANGNSNSIQAYSYKDEIDQPGTYTYRLKMIDMDGNFTYSNDVKVNIEKPLNYAITQNYPNPFNPITIIKYSLPVNCMVTLKVFDVLGNEVASLVNEIKNSGIHKVEFDASTLSSGIYFYKITAVNNSDGSNFSEIRKMVLTK
jgi:hypothetical protein